MEHQANEIVLRENHRKTLDNFKTKNKTEMCDSHVDVVFFASYH